MRRVLWEEERETERGLLAARPFRERKSECVDAARRESCIGALSAVDHTSRNNALSHQTKRTISKYCLSMRCAVMVDGDDGEDGVH